MLYDEPRICWRELQSNYIKGSPCPVTSDKSAPPAHRHRDQAAHVGWPHRPGDGGAGPDWAGWPTSVRRLSQMWDLQRGEPLNFLKTKKLSDLLALLSAFAAIIVTICVDRFGQRDRVAQASSSCSTSRTSRCSASCFSVASVLSLSLGHLVAVVHVDHCPPAAGVGELPERDAGWPARCGRIRDLQAGGIALTSSR